MNGLNLSESYYTGCAKEIFENRFKALMERVAIGLVGPGSECFGFDDEFSRDHDWGPSFCLWVSREDFQRYGKELQACYDALPQEYLGFGPRVVSPGEKGRVGVMETSAFYRHYTGLNSAPNSITDHAPALLGRIKDQEFKNNLKGVKMNLPTKQELVKKIVEGERHMFSTVNAKVDSDPLKQGQPTCRDFPEEFKIHRIATLMAWSERTLVSYLDDITTARNTVVVN